MTKEILLEDLVRRSAPIAQETAAPKSSGGSNQVWHEVIGAGDALGTHSLWLIVGLSILVSMVVLSFVCWICFCRHGSHSGTKKRKPLGIKRAAYFKDHCYTKANRNPPPVFNPDKGSHYLKKSPSPTGVKSPPGVHHHHVNEEHALHKKSGQHSKQTSPSDGGDTPTNEHWSDGKSKVLGQQHKHYLSQDEYQDDVVLSSSTSAGGGNGLGRLKFTIRYSFEKNALVVTINGCEGLPPKDMAAKSSDPYVKLQLLPEKQHKVKTRVMRRTLNPVYDEDFTFYGINFNQLVDLTLHFVVLSFDRYSRDDVIGEVMVSLSDLDSDLSASDQHPIRLCREVAPRSLKIKAQGRGELLVSLCYQPAANRITVVVLKARNLPKMDITGLSDPYVKIYLLYNDQRIAKKKTHVKKRTLNPVFNESFVFDLPNLDNDGLANISLEFLLLDWDRVTKNEVIGRLDLGGPTCVGSALHHWKEVINSPRRQIAEWHKLHE